MYDDIYEYEIRIFRAFLPSVRIECLNWDNTASQLAVELRSAVDTSIDETIIEVHNLWNPDEPQAVLSICVNDDIVGVEFLNGYGLPYPDGPRHLTAREILRRFF